jgi:hypothetical protein
LILALLDLKNYIFILLFIQLPTDLSVGIEKMKRNPGSNVCITKRTKMFLIFTPLTPLKGETKSKTFLNIA